MTTDAGAFELDLNTLSLGDCLEVLKQMSDNSVDVMITDPPYGIKFMGKNWDKAIPSVEIWKECQRVLKPGAFAFIMCAPRQDLLCRMTDNLEKAGLKTGFTPIYWTYASGFPKAHNIGKAIFKKAGAQQEVVETSKRLNGSYGGFQPKPAVEVILVVMKPLDQKCYTKQALLNGKGITWLNDCRVPYNCEKDKPSAGNRTCNFGEQEPKYRSKSNPEWKADETGRFPANLLVSDNILDGSSQYYSLDKWSNFHLEDLPQSVQDTFPFLAVSKPSKKEKEAGLESHEDKQICGRDIGQDMRNNPYKLRPALRKNIHPTVKPLALMTYLIKMGSRKGDVVLDPFMGSGTTCIAALLTNRRSIGIEKEEEYFSIAKERCKSALMSNYCSQN
uniref:Methyltransferase n=1 Tax=uncultured Desulfobacterium sp. TaxID=201089 RepID=E1Y992_9BACT|nr:hypothetical protein N47_A11650 [uncultured Desulfobacterium sp.]